MNHCPFFVVLLKLAFNNHLCGMKKIRWKKWLWTLLTVYLLIGMAFYFLQDYVLFRPVSLKRETSYSFSQPHREISIPLDDNDTLHLVDFSSTDSITRGIVLYFHGNKKNIAWYAKYMPHFTKKGYQVLMIDYPGYGKSTGTLTEKKLYDWARQVYKIALKRFSADSIIIYGKSLGTGIAAELASARGCKRLILETPYYDFPAVVNRFLPVYPVRWMLHYQLPTHEYLRDVRAPVTLLHGTRDGVISYKNAERLSRQFKQGDELITVRGGSHNNLFDYPETLTKLDSLLSR